MNAGGAPSALENQAAIVAERVDAPPKLTLAIIRAHTKLLDEIRRQANETYEANRQAQIDEMGGGLSNGDVVHYPGSKTLYRVPYGPVPGFLEPCDAAGEKLPSWQRPTRRTGNTEAERLATAKRLIVVKKGQTDD